MFFALLEGCGCVLPLQPWKALHLPPSFRVFVRLGAGLDFTRFLSARDQAHRAVIRARPFKGPWVEIPRRGVR